MRHAAIVASASASASAAAGPWRRRGGGGGGTYSTLMPLGYGALLLALIATVTLNSLRMTRSLVASGPSSVPISTASSTTSGETTANARNLLQREGEDPASQGLDDDGAARTQQHLLVPGQQSNSQLLLNLETIQESLLLEAPWAESHGADHLRYLGAGMLYYGFAYSHRAATIVVLGSGGGFVPRLLRQAQRDLVAAGISSEKKHYQLILIDAHLPEAGWGSTFYAENLDTVMRREFPDIEYLFLKTDEAYEALRERTDFAIDYLHVDADHSHVQSLRDFENFSRLLSPTGVVSFHDTCRDPRRRCTVTGVPQTLDAIRNNPDKYGLQLLDMDYLYRGIAFAVRSSGQHQQQQQQQQQQGEGDDGSDIVPAPIIAIEAPTDRRINFCRTNAARLLSQSPGFSLNGRVGALGTLGDYYHCHERFNVTELLRSSGRKVPCPFGKRRDSKGACSKCVPGMKGPDCQQYKYEQLRQREQRDEQQLPMNHIARHVQTLAAAWLREPYRNAQHVLEWGISADTKQSLFDHHMLRQSPSTSMLQSVVTVDPLVSEPKWTDPWDSPPALRWLPCLASDVFLSSAPYRDHVNLEVIDTVVCWQCDDRVGSTPESFAVFVRHRLPSVRTLILEGDAAAAAATPAEEVAGGGSIDGLVSALLQEVNDDLDDSSSSWQLEVNMVMSDAGPSSNNHDPSNPPLPRQIVLLTKKR